MIELALQAFSPNLVDDVREILSYDFMQRAIVAGTFIALAAGLVGYFIVLRNEVFTSDALGHVAFTGGLASLLANLQLLLGVFGGTIAVAVGMGSLGGRGRGRDVATGTVFAWVLGVGALFLSLYTSARSAGGGTAGVTILFGSILGLQEPQATIAAGAAIATSLVLLAIARPLMFVSIDPDVAAARGVPTALVTVLFLVLVGATVAEAVQAVGALLIFGLMVTPAAIAQRVTSRPYAGMLLSGALAVCFVWLGLGLAFYLAYPASFFITALAFGTYLASALASRSGRLRLRSV
ncbi:MAG TPA: metal ABC transporter permease [Candidatus Acidoferrales bacterium]|nr:metal ABC transporter permease [Candidatus Acidoferrales bacterium]